MSEQLRPGARLWDAAALGLVLAGGIVYARASTGLEQLTAIPVGRGSYIDANLAAWKSHRDMGNVGLGMIIAGIAVGVIYYLRTRRRTPAPTA